MKPIASIAAFAAVTLAAAGVSTAAELHTAPFAFVNGGDLGCQIANIGNRARTAVITHVNAITGEALATPTEAQIPPGTGAFRALSFEVLTLAYCKFSVDGGKGNFRAMGCSMSGGAASACVGAE